jgi:Tol biopolymer transport system component
LSIAKQIAEAFEAAHERGIIHRDLKPANIKLTQDGRVKVLDFGLAKAYETDASKAVLSNSPTMASIAGTNVGVILGTAAYMSPEQARGVTVDRRTDIFAFGAVLYEMLTAKQAFQGEMVSDILACVLKTEPDWTRLPVDTPANIKLLLRRCLEKERNRRLDSAAAIRIEIEDEPQAKVPQSIPPLPEPHRLPWILVAAFSVLVAVLAIPTVRYLSRSRTDTPEMRLEINTPSTAAPLEFALSPDARYITFVASGGGPQRLWLRALDKTDAQPLAGTEGADFPFWSADSRSIAFTASGKLQRIDIGGGPPQVLAITTVTRGGTWNADGTILFNASLGPLSRVTASGGDAVAFTQLDPRLLFHIFPQFLPDGRHFLFFASGTPETSGLYLGSIDATKLKRLVAADTNGAYLPSGMTVFIRGTSLIAQHLDLKRGELTGDPIRLADPVSSSGLGFGAFSVSADGRIAYRGGGLGLRQLNWYDRAGKVVGKTGESDSGTPAYPELSPDGRTLALQRFTQSNNDVWLMDLIRGGMTRFTFDSAVESAPIWSPDGMRIVFYSTRKGHADLYVKASSGAGAEEVLLETPNNKYPQDWSKDGNFVLYSEADPKTGRDLWALPLKGKDAKPIVVVRTPFEELSGQFSPDGHWVAYQTNESGRFEIVVQPFPNPTGKWQVSTGGGIQPRWSADGKQLYFIGPDETLMAASITLNPTFAAGTPVALFPLTLAPGGAANRQQYAVSRDGRFLASQPVEESTTMPITLILNWKPKP